MPYDFHFEKLEIYALSKTSAKKHMKKNESSNGLV